MSFFWGLILGFVVGVLYMADRANVDNRSETP